MIGALVLLLVSLGGAAAAAQGREDARPSGEKLARTYCTACHLFTEPELLTKKQWSHHVLPQMATWLGVEPVNYENIQDGRILEEANIFPKRAVVSDEDWWKIWNYYVEAAPNRPLPPAGPAKAGTPNVKMGLKQFQVRKANIHSGAPMTCLVKIDPAERMLYVGDAFAGILAMMNPAKNELKTLKLGSPPISLSLIEAGICVTLVGRFAPSEAAEGKVLLLHKEDQNVRLPLLENLRRPVDTQVADLDGDAREDLVVCSFGNRLGRFSWFRNVGPAKYEEQVLLGRPGAVASALNDVDGDGDLDIFVLMAQAQEGLFLFRNDGKGSFHLETIVEQHPSFGFAGFSLADFNGDGRVDVLTANGDNGDFPLPHKGYHGLRIYLNEDGRGGNDGALPSREGEKWKEAWFYPMEGAYKAIPTDFDKDGDLDIAAISFYPDYGEGPDDALPSKALSFVYLKNESLRTATNATRSVESKAVEFKFEPFTMAESNDGRWMVMDAGDLDGDGDIDIALGSFVMGPTTIPVPASVRAHWKANGAGVLILENRLR